MPRQSTLRSLFLTAIALWAAAAWFGAATQFGGVFRPLSGLNGPLYDASLALAGVLQPRGWMRTAVVLVDQRTLDSPAWASTPRALQQPQLGRLGDLVLSLGARRIGFDLVFAFDPSALNLPLSPQSAYDATFTKLLTEHSDRIVLGADASISPAARYVALLPRTGLGAIDLTTEPDGIVRSVLTRTRLSDGQRALGFAQALTLDGATNALAAGHAIIGPRAPIDTIPHLSALDLETCLSSPAGTQALRDLLRDRVVLIGAALAGEDTHRGPDRFFPHSSASANDANLCRGLSGTIPTRAAGALPGLFLQAAATEGLLAPAPLSLADVPTNVVVNLVVVSLALAAQVRVNRAARLPDRRSRLFGSTLRASLALVVVLLAFAIGAVGVETAAILLLHLWFPIGPTLGMVGLLGVAQTLVTAVRRDIALADLRISFGRWLPLPVIEATLGSTPGPVRGQERMITVLVADLMNFTAFCATHRHEPEAVVAALNRKFSAAQVIIDRHGGCLDKFDGDAVIAFWNGIEDQADHARRAVMAAREILTGDPDDDVLTFKCAIATGIAFVGCYGSEHRSSFSAIGEPMNLAARLETLCRPNGLRIVISESTVNAFRSATHASSAGEPLFFDRVGEARLKGFSEPMAFFTLQAHAEPPAPSAMLLADPLSIEYKA